MSNSSTRLSTQSRLLISDQVFRKICDIFFELFLSTYMYKVSEENGVFYLAMYNIIGWITVCVLVFPVSRLINRYNKVWIYRLGVVIKLSIILLVALLGPNISSFYWLVGILYGIMIAFNGYIVNFFESENIPKNELIRYVGIGNAFSSLANTVIPIILGSSIFIGSFETTAFVLTVIVAIELVICFGIKGHQPEKRHKLNYHQFLKIAFRDKNYLSVCFQQLFSGINRNGVMGLLVSVLIYLSVGNEFSLGGWTSFFGLAGIIAMLLFAHFYKNCYRRVAQLTLGFLIVLGCVPLLIEVNFLNIVIFNIVFYTLVRTMEKIVHLDLINYSKSEKYHKKYLYEFYSVREVFLTIGRVIGYGSLALVAILNSGVNGLKNVFMVIMISIALMGIVSGFFKPDKRRR